MVKACIQVVVQLTRDPSFFRTLKKSKQGNFSIDRFDINAVKSPGCFIVLFISRPSKPAKSHVGAFACRNFRRDVSKVVNYTTILRLDTLFYTKEINYPPIHLPRPLADVLSNEAPQ